MLLVLLPGRQAKKDISLVIQNEYLLVSTIAESREVGFSIFNHAVDNKKMLSPFSNRIWMSAPLYAFQRESSFVVREAFV